MIRSALALILLLAALCAHEAHASSRMRTTNVTESAPLNFVAHAFSKIQRTLRTEIESDRLSYRILVPHAPTSALNDLLVDLSGGPADAQVTSLQIVTGATQVAAALDDFVQRAELKPDTVRADGFASAVKAATRVDVKLYRADLSTRAGNVRFLILRDDETQDLLVLSLARPSQL